MLEVFRLRGAEEATNWQTTRVFAEDVAAEVDGVFGIAPVERRPRVVHLTMDTRGQGRDGDFRHRDGRAARMPARDSNGQCRRRSRKIGSDGPLQFVDASGDDCIGGAFDEESDLGLRA